MMKENRKWWLPAALVAVLAAVLLCFLKSQEPVPEFVFSYAENQEADYPTTLGGQYFAKLVEERTDGRIQILVHHSGTHGSESEVVEQLKYGGVDFARVSSAELTDDIKELNVLQLPYLYRNSEHMWKVLDGEIGEYFLDVISETEIIGLSWYDAGARSFYTAEKPIRCLEDMAGMKIRVQESDMMADFVEYLGGEPVKYAYGEVYSMLEKAEVQGAENNWPSYESSEHFEVAKYYTEDEHTRVPEIQICSRHTWEKLSEEERKIIMECAKESALYQRELWSEREAESKKLAIEGGAEVIVLPAIEKLKFQKNIEPLYRKYCGDSMELVNRIISYRND